MLENFLESFIVGAQRWKIRRQFRQSLGYECNFEHPRTYQEKVQFRKLFGNHEFYALVADKYRVREYVTSKAGARYLIPLLGVYDRLDLTIFASLPQQFIIKANHGCKWHEIVRDKSNLDMKATVRRFNKLRRKRYGWEAGERHYNFITPKIVIEELLNDGIGGIPWDYSFFCYHTKGEFDYNFALCSPVGKSALFFKNWELMSSDIPAGELQPHLKPANFDEMLMLARTLSADFDFVRVDLYNVRGQIYFGELTCTPHQGYGPITDQRRQKMRNEMWHLDAENPLLYSRAKLRRS